MSSDFFTLAILWEMVISLNSFSTASSFWTFSTYFKVRIQSISDKAYGNLFFNALQHPYQRNEHQPELDFAVAPGSLQIGIYHDGFSLELLPPDVPQLNLFGCRMLAQFLLPPGHVFYS